MKLPASRYELKEGYRFELWVCTGKELLTDGKAGIGFRQLIDDDGTLAEETHRYTLKGMSATVGGVYLVQTNGNSLLTGRMEWQRTYHDRATVGVWQTESRAVELELSRRALERKEQGINHLLDALEPLRERYHTTNWRTQKAMELIVLDYLRRPLPRDRRAT